MEYSDLPKRSLVLFLQSENALQGAIESVEDGCTLSASFGQSNNAVNRVYNSEKGFELGGNVNGPFDHIVPVLIARRRDRTVLSCMFGYAAHGTVLTKEYRYSNDWMGFARGFVEDSLPGACLRSYSFVDSKFAVVLADDAVVWLRRCYGCVYPWMLR